jgi:hypothetical protein
MGKAVTPSARLSHAAPNASPRGCPGAAPRHRRSAGAVALGGLLAAPALHTGAGASGLAKRAVSNQMYNYDLLLMGEARMPSSRPGFDDLKRRYREADWTSEFQRLWASFNYWLYAYYQGNTTDQVCTEELKKNKLALADRIRESREENARCGSNQGPVSIGIRYSCKSARF